MFTLVLEPAANSAFAISSMLIGLPTGIKIFNWMATMWGGAIKFTTAMWFSVAFIALFTIGGLSGVMHASVPTDAQQQDTYFIVAHFHYVLVGGALMGIFSGIYFWWPKAYGHFLNEKLGKINFWLMFIGMNIQFGPMHWLGMNGMPRRVYTYADNMGWEVSNLYATLGGFILALGILVFVINIFVSKKQNIISSADPWDGRTLEWSIPSPVPVYNFKDVPEVKFRDDFWFKKYPQTIKEYYHDFDEEEIKNMKPIKPDEKDLGENHGIHLPDLSYYPLILAAGVTLLAVGMMTHFSVIVLGGIGIFWGAIGWSLEPVNDPESH